MREPEKRDERQRHRLVLLKVKEDGDQKKLTDPT